jgi:hypothetical protein
MHSLSNKVFAAMDYPLFWLLLVVPATAAVMACQYPEYATRHHTAPGISQPIGIPTVARTDAVVTTELRQQSASEGNNSSHAVIPESQHFVPAVATGSIQVPVSQPSATINRRVRDVEGITVQRSSVSNPGAGNSFRSDQEDTSLVEQSPEDYSGSPAIVADLGTIMSDNPYLPTADTNSYDSVLLESESSPPCPQELYLGGNDYAAIRLAQMGCEAPGS